jgi:putative transposase
MIRGCPTVHDQEAARDLARRPYSTDLTDAEWQLLPPLIPAPKPGGRPTIHDRRELVNAMAYWLRAGCAGGCCPMTCHPGRPSTTSSAAGDSKGCRSKSTIGCMSWNAAGKGGRPRPAQPSSTARASRPPSGGPHGYDGAKRRTGRKRHLLVDTLGLICKVKVTAADVGDRDGAMALRRRLDRRRFPRLWHGWVDGGYRGPSWTRPTSAAASAFRWCRAATAGASRAGCRPGRPRRCPVRGGSPPLGGGADLAWLGRYRRLSRDYKYSPPPPRR